MDNNEIQAREQTLNKIEFYLLKLSDKELRMALGFIRGLIKGKS